MLIIRMLSSVLPDWVMDRDNDIRLSHDLSIDDLIAALGAQLEHEKADTVKTFHNDTRNNNKDTTTPRREKLHVQCTVCDRRYQGGAK